MQYKLIIFDLDGTLLNTLGDLRNSLNTALATEGFPSQTLEETRAHIGNGIMRLISDSIHQEVPEEVLERIHKAFRAHYDTHCTCETRPYEGIPELLAELQKRGCRLAMVSNKVDHAVKALCEFYFPGVFDLCVGELPGVPRKPAPDSLLNVMKALGASPEETLYVGDSEVDALTAQNAGVPVALVTWGFRTREFLQEYHPRYLVDKPIEMLNA